MFVIILVILFYLLLLCWTDRKEPVFLFNFPLKESNRRHRRFFFFFWELKEENVLGIQNPLNSDEFSIVGFARTTRTNGTYWCQGIQGKDSTILILCCGLRRTLIITCQFSIFLGRCRSYRWERIRWQRWRTSKILLTRLFLYRLSF